MEENRSVYEGVGLVGRFIHIIRLLLYQAPRPATTNQQLHQLIYKLKAWNTRSVYIQS